MNTQKVREIISLYKTDFDNINQQEIYKWQAVKHFQNNWDIEAEDFAGMLGESLSRTGNLLASGNYFPARMILKNAHEEPETVKQFFRELYDEETDWAGRVEDFKKGFSSLNDKNFPGRKSYQDDRAVSVYLTLRFPDIYFFYKYTMFEEFVGQIEYPYKPKIGSVENLPIYFNLCELLRDEIVKDARLLELHTRRLARYDCSDNASNILTQDVIYATVWHLKNFMNPAAQPPASRRLVEVDKRVRSKPDDVTLQGRFVHHIENEKARKRIGDLGELLVLELERERLRTAGSPKQPEHVAKTRGDGEGYDILSFDESGKELFIEVKTTTGNFDAPFFVTRNELEKSIREKESFYLYRLYFFDEKENAAIFFVRRGSLEALCINPLLYRVRVEEEDAEFYHTAKSKAETE